MYDSAWEFDAQCTPQVVYPFVKKIDVLRLLEEHITANIVKVWIRHITGYIAIR
jgi:hypothetical protein